MGPLFIKGVRWFRIRGYLKLDKDPDRVAKQRDRFMFNLVVMLSSHLRIVVVQLVYVRQVNH